MVLVRFGRKLKNRKVSNVKEFVTISDVTGGVKMRVDKNSYMGGSIYWYGFHHLSEMLYLKSFLTKDMVFVDVGANQGEFSLFAASKVTDGKVLAFEPTSYQLGLLKTNKDLNHFDNLVINDYGLFDKPDTVNVYTNYEVELHGGEHEGLSSMYKSDQRSVLEDTIDLKVFDDVYFEKLERCDFVKIDIEGAELPALQGMRKTISKFKPQLLIEMNRETFLQAGYELEDVLSFLDEFNYKGYKVYRGRLVPVSSDSYEDYSNIVFKV